VKVCGGCRRRTPLILNLGARWTWVVNVTLRMLSAWEKTQVRVERKAGWDQSRSTQLGDERTLSLNATRRKNM
jgi:hypothetical protein